MNTTLLSIPPQVRDAHNQILLCLAYDPEASGTSSLSPLPSLLPLNFNTPISYLLQ